MVAPKDGPYGEDKIQHDTTIHRLGTGSFWRFCGAKVFNNHTTFSPTRPAPLLATEYCIDLRAGISSRSPGGAGQKGASLLLIFVLLNICGFLLIRGSAANLNISK